MVAAMAASFVILIRMAPLCIPATLGSLTDKLFYSGTGVPPATVAEWTLQGAGNLDYYDVSLVDGYNLPMKITNNVGCNVASCGVDLGPNCSYC